MAESYINRQKTLWEKEKLVVTSNCSFSHGVFKRLELQTCKNQGFLGKRLTHYHTRQHFDAVKIYSCGKHCEKRRNSCNKQFLLFSHCFLPYMALIFHFQCTLKCCLQFLSIWTSLKFCRLAMA